MIDIKDRRRVWSANSYQRRKHGIKLESFQTRSMHERVMEIVSTNKKVMRRVVYKASELKKLGVVPGRNPDVQAEAQLNNDHSEGRRLSA